MEFYKNKKVFLTGHTGFKGAWLSKILTDLGAEVTGYSLPPHTTPNLFEMLDFGGRLNSVIGDIRDFDGLYKAYCDARPEIVFHLAAQPIVHDGYENPVYTYHTNVMGTVNLLECIRLTGNAHSVVNVTTDKVYANNEWEWGYRENEPLCGYDPYSNSKSCSELVTYSYNQSYFRGMGIPVSTARAGNVIGGGDFSKARIIPDCVRAAQCGETVKIRNPYSTRPYQHVLEPLFAYLMIAEKQSLDFSLADCYNVGPDDAGCVTTSHLVDVFCRMWGGGMSRMSADCGGPHEASFLKLDCSKIKSRLGWKPLYSIDEAVLKTVEWVKAYIENRDVNAICEEQIKSCYSKLEEGEKAHD
ncbi:MAG: CDP-glucose 4,6-dehydratase [Oscillospiraceae bacterium]|nr:CDP-glucose 4,6-dehydratase [Oscillospiraceae bacterium]